MSNPKEQEIATLRAWSESAPYWDKHAPVVRAMFEPLSDALIKDSALGPGKSALDVAAVPGMWRFGLPCADASAHLDRETIELSPVSRNRGKLFGFAGICAIDKENKT